MPFSLSTLTSEQQHRFPAEAFQLPTATPTFRVVIWLKTDAYIY